MWQSNAGEYVRDCSATWEDDESEVDLSVKDAATGAGSGGILRFDAESGARSCSLARLCFGSCSTPICVECVEVNSSSLSLLS